MTTTLLTIKIADVPQVKEALQSIADEVRRLTEENARLKAEIATLRGDAFAQLHRGSGFIDMTPRSRSEIR